MAMTVLAMPISQKFQHLLPRLDNPQLPVYANAPIKNFSKEHTVAFLH